MVLNNNHHHYLSVYEGQEFGSSSAYLTWGLLWGYFQIVIWGWAYPKVFFSLTSALEKLKRLKVTRAGAPRASLSLCCLSIWSLQPAWWLQRVGLLIWWPGAPKPQAWASALGGRKGDSGEERLTGGAHMQSKQHTCGGKDGQRWTRDTEPSEAPSSFSQAPRRYLVRLTGQQDCIPHRRVIVKDINFKKQE